MERLVFLGIRVNVLKLGVKVGNKYLGKEKFSLDVLGSKLWDSGNCCI